MPTNLTSKLVPPETRSDAEEHDTRIVVGADVAPINNFVQWFQVISANMNMEAQRRALAASRKAASSVFADVGDDEVSSIAAETAPVRGDVRRVKYSVEMAEVGFPSQSRDGGCPLRG